MAAGDGSVWLLIRHPGVTRAEIADALRSRWPGAVVGDAGAAEPSWEISSVEDAVELARARRGVEPLRIIILAQRNPDANAGRRAAEDAPPLPVEPMPIVL
jgi:hypothetical protein